MKYIKYFELKKATTHPFIQSAKRGSNAKVQEYIKSGADINIRDTNGRTALMWACLNNFLMVVKTLIDAGADINMIDYEGRTVLMMASTMKIYDLLFSVNNIDVNLKNNKGQTAIMEVLSFNMFNNNIITLLKNCIKKGLDLNIKDINGNNFYDILKEKQESGVNIGSVIEIMDNNYPQYKEEWNFKHNVIKYNL